MRKIATFILCAILISKIAIAQNSINIVTYKAMFAEKFSEGSSANKDLGFLDEIVKGKEVFFELIFNKNEANYKQKNELDVNDFDAKIKKALFGGNTFFYLNTKNREYISQIEAYGEIFLVPLVKWKWKLTNESKKIGSYKCYKATTIKTVDNSEGVFSFLVTAWFTNEIPVNFGPKGYYGLPGLILELHENKQVHFAQNIKLNQNSINGIEKPTKGIKMTHKEFEAFGKNFYEKNKKI
ncbi:MAG: GLPGLI family protein [Flavobacteriales bacterium]|nr:GLPGLI family protein [Flavobacteriia bacterium]NCP07163.1 GLPGLI family protein [Flavobacteriales bacterium]PIV93440.1 MAG: GLPGLI family protein [Flavobacteriaceae bacterium CG17_big_fil_post_rev_8_21_14_2_50_33_15]PIY12887.1 MAG: GLPGLI family protein [Flavobacteriaceae bacterium CG_4_10_14_3_um_filter_33_47]PJB18427.1 MAG: GLPGLI family protein [Flavobacteriaceae bacterium CG_4_9_14_3_um_filter_33_16]